MYVFIVFCVHGMAVLEAESPLLSTKLMKFHSKSDFFAKKFGKSRFVYYICARKREVGRLGRNNI